MPKNNSKAVRELRRKQAEERQSKYSALSIQDKIVRASDRPGKSDREITRLGVEAGIYPADIAEQRKAFSA